MYNGYMQSLKALKILLIIVFIFLLGFVILPKNISAPSPQVTPNPQTSNECKIGGCSNQLCIDANSEDVATTCEYADYYVCYETATCEKQLGGKCDWTQTEELKGCLANPPKLMDIEPSL